jgi:hypothetical protein
VATTDARSVVTTEAKELWEKSFQGEVFGETVFAAMAEQMDDPERRRKMEALTALERCTKELLGRSMTRLGLSTAVDQAMVDAVANGAPLGYEVMLASLLPITAEYLGYYARLRELVGPEDFEVIDLLIAHEMALELFTRREMAGETQTSLQPIFALPHVTL